MTQFYVSNVDAYRCHDARRQEARVAIRGTNSEQARVFNGIVRLVEFFPNEKPGRQFRVTIDE